MKTKNFRKPYLDKEGLVHGVVSVDLDEVIGHTIEDFLDLLSTRLTGTELLCDIRYTIVGIDKPDTFYFEVVGDPSMIEDGPIRKLMERKLKHDKG